MVNGTLEKQAVLVPKRRHMTTCTFKCQSPPKISLADSVTLRSAGDFWRNTGTSRLKQMYPILKTLYP